MPFVIYADFESVLKKPAEDADPKICQNHEALSFGYYIKCSYDDSLSKYEFYRGPEPAKWFINKLRDFAKFADKVLDSENQVPILKTKPNTKYQLPLKPEENEAYEKADKCFMCSITGFEGENWHKVQDHCHLTGKFR